MKKEKRLAGETVYMRSGAFSNTTSSAESYCLFFVISPRKL